MVGDGSLVTGVWSQGTLETVKKTLHIILVYMYIYSVLYSPVYGVTELALLSVVESQFQPRLLSPAVHGQNDIEQ